MRESGVVPFLLLIPSERMYECVYNTVENEDRPISSTNDLTLEKYVVQTAYLADSDAPCVKSFV